MIVRVLGSAAGGGLPQWNCGCVNCRGARAGRLAPRSQSSLAVSGDGERWWLINVSPDVAQQIESFPPLQPQGTRGTPIAGMLLTDANVDHIGGLAILRQAGPHAFRVLSSAVVRDIALQQPAFIPFAESPHAWEVLPFGTRIDLDGRLSAEAIPVHGTTPGYAGRRALTGAVVAIAVVDRTNGKRLLAAPVYAELDAALRAAIAASDVAFLDGSFFFEDELAAYDVAAKAARRLGHLPVGAPDGSLPALRSLTEGRRLIFTHLNNTNPLVDENSAEAQRARDAGFEIASDGLQLEL